MNPNLLRDPLVKEFDQLVYSKGIVDVEALKGWMRQNWHIAALHRDVILLLNEAVSNEERYGDNAHQLQRNREWLLNRMREQFHAIFAARGYLHFQVEQYEETVLYDFVEWQDWNRPLRDDKLLKVFFELQEEVDEIIKLVKKGHGLFYILENITSREPDENFDLSGWTREIIDAYADFPPSQGKTDFEVWKENQGYRERPKYY